jgi:hypothetical protein
VARHLARRDSRGRPFRSAAGLFRRRFQAQEAITVCVWASAPPAEEFTITVPLALSCASCAAVSVMVWPWPLLPWML